jgi:SNF2 family DNA or RNA helicase/intein/homing endonuclease
LIVLHALWDNVQSDKLHIWAETSNQPASSPKRSERKAETSPAQLHPFALSSAALQEMLGELAGSLHTRSTATGTLTLQLPSTAKEPVASPELLLAQESSGGKATGFKSWKVETLSLDPGLALDVLLVLPDYATSRVAFGGSLRFWKEAAKFALALLTRQCYMPALEETKQQNRPVFRAIWQAVLIGEDAERLSLLTKAMPPLCWSLLPAGEMKFSALQNIVQSFLNHTLDAFIRENLSATSLLLVQRNRTKRNSASSVPEQWLTALASDNPVLTAPPDELRGFTEKLRGWLEQIRPVDANAAFRTCFRLDAPGTDESQGSGWHISFYLQANDDRSLLVPVEKVWNERSNTLTFLQRTFENPQERVLADLGKASRLFPTLEKSLRTARPMGLNLDTEQAYSFLRESAPLLEQSGFGVLVPPWWNKPTARLGVKLKVKPKASAKDGAGLLGLNNIVAYDWTIAVGDTTLTIEEFEDLVDLKVPLIKIRGQWVELRPEEIEAAIAFFKKKHGQGDMSLGEALRIGLGQETSELGLPVTDIEASGWISEMLDKLTDGMKIAPIQQPSTLNGKLRPYQLKGVSWLAFLERFGLGACLADDMGLGKCVSGTTILTVNGTLQKAEDIWRSYAGESMYDGQGYWADPGKQLLTNSIDETSGRIVQTSIKRLYRQQVSETVRTVRLEDGNSVTITRSHKLLTDKGWTNDLHVGNYVCVPARLVWNGKAEDPDLIKMLAWQIAEGHEFRSQSAVAITQKDISVLQDLQICLRRLSEKYSIKINCPSVYPGRNGKAPHLRCTSVAYRRFLEARGYLWGQLSRDKSIPDFIMQADLNSVRIFLRNFFEAEASVVSSMNSIEISTASPVLMQQLSYLLRRFGIWLRVSTKQKRATNGSGIFRPYQIGVLGGNAARTFCKEIGFAGEKKQQRLEKICALVNNTNVEGIPASSIMAQLVSTTKLPIRHFGMNTVYVTGTQQFSSSSLTRVIDACESILSGEVEQEYRKKASSKWTVQTLESYAQLDKQLLTTTKLQLRHLIEREVYYCRIKSIEEVEYNGWVYDFEVEQHHNFVADNIICHNTVQLITLLLHERVGSDNKEQPPPTLLICPMSIVGNWHRELQRFAPSLKVMIHHGHERLSGEAFAQEARQNDVVITTYALALRDKEHLALIEWDNVVVDEAQNIKNDTAKQTQAIKQLQGQHKIALTGTPVENRLSELWSIMEFLNPGYLGSATDFRKNFAIPIERYREANRSEALKRLIQPFVLRRLKTDKTIIADLPDKMEMKVYCNLTQEQASLYEAVVKDMMAKIEEAEGIERKGLVLSTLMKLKQVCNHPAQFVADGSALSGRSGKLARLEEMLEEVLAEGDKALIFTQFAQMGKLLRGYLQERFACETLFLHGGTPKKQRDIMVQRFQEERRGAPLFLLSLKAGGVGLNLTAANHVFHFDRWWNPAVENQATDRAFRIGQKRNVQVHKFVCIGTMEEHIDQMIEQKKELAESIVGTGENWLTEMSTAQLRELFALSRESVSQ